MGGGIHHDEQEAVTHAHHHREDLLYYENLLKLFWLKQGFADIGLNTLINSVQVRGL